MQKRSQSTLSILALLMAFFVNQSVFAEDNGGTFFGKEAKGKWIIGVKLAKIDNNIENIKDADAVGIVLAYKFNKLIGGQGSSTVELEYLSGDNTDLQGIGRYEEDILNLFFTYRSPGTLYYKAKLGLSYSDLRVDFPAFGFSNEDVALAGGIGIGYHVGDYGVVELEYSADTGENDLGIIGFNALLEF